MKSYTKCRGVTAGKAHKAWALRRFWVSICFYKKQPVKRYGVEYLALHGSNSTWGPWNDNGNLVVFFFAFHFYFVSKCFILIYLQVTELGTAFWRKMLAKKVLLKAGRNLIDILHVILFYGKSRQGGIGENNINFCGVSCLLNHQ